jgi:hypothetical protein
MNFDIGATPEAESQLENRAQNIRAPIEHWGCQSSTKQAERQAANFHAAEMQTADSVGFWFAVFQFDTLSGVWWVKAQIRESTAKFL